MRKRQIFLVISLIVSACSCKNDSDEGTIKYPLSYESYSIEETEIKVYAKNGEITSMNLKKEITDRYKNFLTNLDTVNLEGKIVATYLSEDSVELSVDNKKEEKSRQIKELNGLVYWEKQDTSDVFNFISLLTLMNYKPLYFEEFYIPTASGFTKFAKCKECFFAKEKENGFELPMIDLLYKEEFRLLKITEINNEFSENFLSQLYENDTIIIQEYNIEMKLKDLQ